MGDSPGAGGEPVGLGSLPNISAPPYDFAGAVREPPLQGPREENKTIGRAGRCVPDSLQQEDNQMLGTPRDKSRGTERAVREPPLRERHQAHRPGSPCTGYGSPHAGCIARAAETPAPMRLRLSRKYARWGAAARRLILKKLSSASTRVGRVFHEVFQLISVKKTQYARTGSDAPSYQGHAAGCCDRN